MRLNCLSGSTFAAALAVPSVSLLLAAAASAQCVTTCPGGSVVQSDGCADVTDSTNGGCNINATNPPLDNYGTLLDGVARNYCGSVGTVGTAGRDLDWVKFTLSAPATVTLSATHNVVATNQPAPNFTMFVFPIDCAADAIFAAASATCPFSTGNLFLAPGEYIAVFTVNAFAPDAPACPVNYVGTVTALYNVPATCGTGGDCVTETLAAGCADLECCATVCASFTTCCDTAWDALCVELAVEQCGFFIYDCSAPLQANDCAESPAVLALDTTVAFNNTGANTDGPALDCQSTNDIWYIVQAPDDGELEIVINTPGVDSVIGLYGNGITSTVVGSSLLDNAIGCIDAFAAGGEGVVLIDAVGGEYYLIQVAGFAGAQGAGDITATFRRLVFSTGNSRALQFSAPNNGVFTPTNLGWSSGKLSAANPQRWFATPFTVSNPGAGQIWALTAINAYGFAPAGVTNEFLNYKIWARTSLAVPPSGPVFAEGSVPFPVPYDLPDGAANENHEIALDPLLEIPAGDYWLTVYADNSTPNFPTAGAVAANFAWFTNAPDGIDNLDENGNPFGWRSSMFPTPGFIKYQLAATNIQQAVGLDPNEIYNPGFRILGVKNPAPVSPCPFDQAGGGENGDQPDGNVDGADLGALLSAWGACGATCPWDLAGGGGNGDEPDGSVDGADLGALLAVWGTCPE